MTRPTWIRNLFTRRPATIRNRPAPSHTRARLGVETFEDRLVPSQFFGAIYTSDSDGTVVNGNVYPNKEAVYLNGGPQNENSQGLPDGTYFFQVTDPSGATLLSTDSAWNRQLVVVDGVVYGVPPDGGLPNQPAGTYHATGSLDPDNGSIPVQLMPYADTPNNGGEYKAWLIRQTDTTTVRADDPNTPDYDESRIIDFLSRDAKTDNFKVRTDNVNEFRVITISGYKFYDTDVNGIWRDKNTDFGSTKTTDPAAELPINDWRMELYRENGKAPGLQTDGPNMDDWVDFVNTGNYGDPGKYVFAVTVTNPGPAQTYYVNESLTSLPGTWVQTTFFGGNSYATIDVPAGNNDVERPNNDFGNVLLGAGGGLTLGFWSNKNGYEKMNDGGSITSELCMLDKLNLTNYDGVFNGGSGYPAPTSGALKGVTSAFMEFRTWILNANATDMNYMLSAQLAAMALNVESGGVNGNSLVYGGSSLGFLTINDLMNRANLALADPNATREYKEQLKTALDKANNNLNFVQLAINVDKKEPWNIIDYSDFI